MMRPLYLPMLCAALTGCGLHSASPAVPLLPISSAFRGDGIAPRAVTFVFTCQNGTVFDCLLYTKHGKLKRTHTKNVESPLGVVGSKDGRFYVANEFGNDVLVYSPGARKLLGSLQNGGNVPIDVAVFNGELAVANQHVMTFFANGATTPTRTLNAPNVLQGSGAAFDAAGNCYWSFSNNSGKQTIVEFTRCKGRAHELKVTPGSPFGVAFDGSGRSLLHELLIPDQRRLPLHGHELVQS